MQDDPKKSGAECSPTTNRRTPEELSHGKRCELESEYADNSMEVVIDIRDKATFTAGHIPGATHFDGINGDDGLSTRLAELPDPTARAQQCALVVVSTDEIGATAVTELLRAGFASVRIHTSHSVMTTGLSRRLWKPSSLAVRAEAMATGDSALDVACGGGRDSAWLASRGWNVVAVDRSATLITRAQRLATRCYEDSIAHSRGNVRTVTRTFGASIAEDAAWLCEHAAQFVLIVRFLRRPILSILCKAVAPGGLIAYEHFLEGCERFGAPRKPAQMLRRGELATIFCHETGFNIIVDEVDTLPDGRPVSRFIARRQAATDSKCSQQGNGIWL